MSGDGRPEDLAGTPRTAPVAPGRRAARRQRRAPDRLLVAGVALVVLSGAVLAAAELTSAPAEGGPGVTSVAVDRFTAACAAFPAPGEATAATLVAPRSGASGGADGHPQPVEPTEPDRLTAGPVGGRAEPLTGTGEGLSELDPSASRPADSPPWALGISASGAPAVGRTAFAVHRARVGEALAAQECPRPRAQWWFTGAGATLDHTSTLLLANVDPGPAVVDVEAFSGQGRVEAVGTRGMTIDPGEVVAVELLDVAPQAEEVALSVDASRGRVVAALADRFAARPGAVAGAEWIPPQLAPSRSLRLVALPGTAGRRTVVVRNAGEREALVDVEVVTGSGTFTPTAAPQLRVPPHTVVTADLGDAGAKEPGAVLLTSDVPLTATVRVEARGDVSYAAAAGPLTGPATSLLVSGAGATVQLVAGDRGGSAELMTYTADGQEVESAEVGVEARTSVSWRPRRRAAYLVVRPAGGTLRGAVVLAGGGVSQLPLVPVEWRRAVPAVTPALR